eukprot:CAMPEP_0114546168 /NCGR_PEP_ID=MMETSP0114-20121206/3792_1 /TAXON_ID=31324 /ORGANISM="Goniomonas sp, Strain m" /LENGTH=515 /DNA_ID=CAMNT_0001730649 /DNA_START=246 /DNA_END=1794 /DNA_ORIENTATION=-
MVRAGVDVLAELLWDNGPSHICFPGQQALSVKKVDQLLKCILAHSPSRLSCLRHLDLRGCPGSSIETIAALKQTLRPLGVFLDLALCQNCESDGSPQDDVPWREIVLPWPPPRCVEVESSCYMASATRASVPCAAVVLEALTCRLVLSAGTGSVQTVFSLLLVSAALSSPTPALPAHRSHVSPAVPVAAGFVLTAAAFVTSHVVSNAPRHPHSNVMIVFRRSAVAAGVIGRPDVPIAAEYAVRVPFRRPMLVSHFVGVFAAVANVETLSAVPAALCIPVTAARTRPAPGVDQLSVAHSVATLPATIATPCTACVIFAATTSVRAARPQRSTRVVRVSTAASVRLKTPRPALTGTSVFCSAATATAGAGTDSSASARRRRPASPSSLVSSALASTASRNTPAPAAGPRRVSTCSVSKSLSSAASRATAAVSKATMKGATPLQPSSYWVLWPQHDTASFSLCYLPRYDPAPRPELWGAQCGWLAYTTWSSASWVSGPGAHAGAAGVWRLAAVCLTLA